MIREQAIKEYVIPALMHTWNEKINKEVLEALEQEPTTKNDLGVDAVSRKAVINQIFYSTDNSGDVVLGSALRERIARLPSVTPQPRKGHWYRQTNDYVDYYECSECGMAMGLYDVKNYCPNCGSKNEVEE